MGGPDPCLRQMSGAVAKNRILVDAPPELAFEHDATYRESSANPERSFHNDVFRIGPGRADIRG
jgi:hypothetical protein